MAEWWLDRPLPTSVGKTMGARCMNVFVDFLSFVLKLIFSQHNCILMILLCQQLYCTYLNDSIYTFYLIQVAFPVKGPNRISPKGGLNPRSVRASSWVRGWQLRTIENIQ